MPFCGARGIRENLCAIGHVSGPGRNPDEATAKGGFQEVDLILQSTLGLQGSVMNKGAKSKDNPGTTATHSKGRRQDSTKALGSTEIMADREGRKDMGLQKTTPPQALLMN